MDQQPLGALLLRRGLITEEQLAAALADQKDTGEPLGQIVVSRGYAASAAVAQALATQHGGLLKTEYGFATGFESGGPPTSFLLPPVTPEAAPAPRVQAASAPVAVGLLTDEISDARDTGRAALRAEVLSAVEEAEKLRADNARLTALHSTLEQRLASESQRAAMLERELATANEQTTAPPEIASQPADDSRVSELATALAAREAELEEWKAGIAERDGALADFRLVAEEWKEALAGRDAALAELTSDRDDALAQLREAKRALATLDASVHELTVAKDEALAQVRSADADEALRAARLSDLELENEKALVSLRAAQAEIALLQGLRDEVVACREQAVEAAAQADDLRVERDHALAALGSARAELADEAAVPDGPAVGAEGRWASADRHLLFFQGLEGYELLERSGPPPAPGSTVLLDHGVHAVARVGASAAPGRTIPCAYLIA
jgi:hypothetical protein